MGGKGLFVKELEIALLEKRADIAVHSMKDVPVAFPDGLGLVTICEREDPRDAFVSNKYHSLDDLPAGSIVGTSSLRRQCQLAERRRTSLSVRCAATSAHVSASWTTATMTPLSAVAGLKRLGLESRIRTALPPDVSLPAVGRAPSGLSVVLTTRERRRCSHR